LKAGTRLRAQNSPCEVIVIRGSDQGSALLCGGLEMIDVGQVQDGPQVTDGPAVQLGKRYTDGDGGIEVLCTKPGIGPLAYGGHELTVKAAKPLPASD